MNRVFPVAMVAVGVFAALAGMFIFLVQEQDVIVRAALEFLIAAIAIPFGVLKYQIDRFESRRRDLEAVQEGSA